MQWKGTHLLENGVFSADDAVLMRMPGGRLTACTVDVFTPVVDDPYVYGQIAAANSLSDIYAMGGTPRFALSVLGYPTNLYSPATAAQVLQGAVDKAWEGGVVLAGGHTIKSTDFIFGLAVLGDFPEDKVLTKGGARAGDVLVLTKPLGTGVLSTAIKRRLLPVAEADRLGQLMAALNDKAARLAVECRATACTDVTGFGLLGHLGEMCRESGLRAVVRAPDVPVLDGAARFARDGVVPGGSLDNLNYVADFVVFADSVEEHTRIILADAQTSGGLLVVLEPAQVDRFVSLCGKEEQMAVPIGFFEKGEAGIRVS